MSPVFSGAGPGAIARAALAALLAAAPARADDHADAPGGATPLAIDAWAAGRIEPAGDLDCFSFQGTAGARYVLSTRSGSLMDTTLTLVDTDGATVLAFDDDSGFGRASRIAWQAPADGTYYLVVAHYDPAQGVGSYWVRAARETSAAASSGGGGAARGTGTAALAEIDAPRLYDPKLEDAARGGRALLPIEVRLGGAGATFDCDLGIVDAAGAPAAWLFRGRPLAGGSVLQVDWDGAALGGATVDPGAFRLRLELRSGNAVAAVVERELWVVRLGAVEIALSPAPGWGAEHDYLFHRAGGVSGAYSIVRASAPKWRIGPERAGDPGDLDRADGRPRPSPAPWANLDSPPATSMNVSLPAVIDEGARPRVRVRLGARPVSEASGQVVHPGYPVAGLPVRVVVNGIPASPPGVSPGSSASADLAVPLPAAVERVFLDLEVRFEYRENQVWRPIPGGQRAAIRVYTVLGAAPLGPPGAGAGAPYLPWVAALDLAAGFVGGRAGDERGVVRLVADGVFDHSALYYDRNAGAPAYANGPLDDLELDLSGFFARANGRAVNCSDCATLVAALSEMVGADVGYAILGWSFTLNDLRPIGFSSFTNDLFGLGTRSAFSFHAIATRDGARSVEDACLALDGDAWPASPPHSEVWPRAMPFADYKAALAQTPFSVVGPTRRPRLR
jgi:hypothetical protein